MDKGDSIFGDDFSYWKGMMLNASECVGLGAGMIEEGCLRNGLPIRFTSRKPDEQP